MSEPARRLATYADLEAVPPNLVAEIINGALVTHPRPAPRHGAAAGALGYELTGPFQRGRGGPGGWVFIPEPELHLGPHVLVPDIAGWRRERAPMMPTAAWIETIPDWACEVLSPSTEAYDRGAKRTLYAAHGLKHYWLLDPRTKVLEAFEISNGKWLLLATFSGDEMVAAAPFAEVPFPLAALWPLDAPSLPA